LTSRRVIAQYEEGDFKMAQNAKLAEPKEIKEMNKADICRELYSVADFHLFGAGSWPADPEASAAFWKLLDDFGMTTDVPDKPGRTQFTSLGLELNAELMSIFAGAINLWDIPTLLDLMGYLNDKEATAIYAAESQHPERVIRQHVRRVYLKFRNRPKRLN
jgi:hypothetical protein